MKLEAFDKYWIGIVIGLLLPAVFGYLYIDRMNLWYSISTFGVKSLAGMLGKLTVVAVFPDAAFLFVFYTLGMWRLAKGVIVGMIPYVLAALIIAL